MAKSKIIRIIRLLRERLKQKNIRVEKITLFGSQARNTAHSDSDIDLAIVSPDFEGRDIFERVNMLSGIHWELAHQVKMPFDIVAVSPTEWKEKDSLPVSYVREGKVIYQAKKPTR